MELFTREQSGKAKLFGVKPMNTIGLYGPQAKRNFEKHEMKLLCLIMEMKVSPSPETEQTSNEILNDVESDFIYNILKKRCDFYEIKFDPIHLVFICVLSGGIPGHAIMFLHAANAARVILGKDKICIFDMFNFFVDGVPTEKALDEWWVSSYRGNIDTSNVRVWPKTITDIEASATGEAL